MESGQTNKVWPDQLSVAWPMNCGQIHKLWPGLWSVARPTKFSQTHRMLPDPQSVARPTEAHEVWPDQWLVPQSYELGQDPPPTMGYDTLQIEWPKSLPLLVVVQNGWKLVKGADFSRR